MKKRFFLKAHQDFSLIWLLSFLPFLSSPTTHHHTNTGPPPRTGPCTHTHVHRRTSARKPGSVLNSRDAGAGLPAFTPGFLVLQLCDPHEVTPPPFAFLPSFIHWGSSRYVPHGALIGIKWSDVCKILGAWPSTCVVCF